MAEINYKWPNNSSDTHSILMIFDINGWYIISNCTFETQLSHSDQRFIVEVRMNTPIITEVRPFWEWQRSPSLCSDRLVGDLTSTILLPSRHVLSSPRATLFAGCRPSFGFLLICFLFVVWFHIPIPRNLPWIRDIFTQLWDRITSIWDKSRKWTASGFLRQKVE